MISNARDFARRFEAKVADRAQEIKSTWSDPPAYTKVLLGREHGVLSEIARDFQLSYRRELLNIDACYVSGVREPLLVHIAIEHENNPYSSFWEANKLALLGVPLKVLITYPLASFEDPQLLAEYDHIIRACTTSADHRGLDEFLSIFASIEGDDVNWRYYAKSPHSGEAFVQLNLE